MMSQDPALPPAKVAAVLTAYIEQLSGEYTVPEFRGVQVGIWESLHSKLDI